MTADRFLQRTNRRRAHKLKLPGTSSLKKFFLNWFWSDRAAPGALLSPGGCDRIFGCDPPHSNPPNSSLETLKINNRRSRLAAEGVTLGNRLSIDPFLHSQQSLLSRGPVRPAHSNRD